MEKRAKRWRTRGLETLRPGDVFEAAFMTETVQRDLSSRLSTPDSARSRSVDGRGSSVAPTVDVRVETGSFEPHRIVIRGTGASADAEFVLRRYAGC